MKFLQIGLGSMGKRRIRNLLELGVKRENIFGFDLVGDRCEEVSKLFNIRTFKSFSKSVSTLNPDVYIISTPPHLHKKYFLHAAKNKKHFFVEVASTDDGYTELLPLLKNEEFVAAPSCTYRYFDPIIKMKNIVDSGKIGKPLAFVHHIGQYLPEWHPWEDYKKFYGSKAKSSACLEMILFEMNWIQWVLDQKIVKVSATFGKISDLKIEGNEVYAISARTEGGILGTMMVDIISRPAYRTFRVLGSKGSLEWSLTKEEIDLCQVEKKFVKIRLRKGTKISGYKTTTEEMYASEMEDFLEAMYGRIKYPYTFDQEYQNFILLKKIKMSK